MINPDRRVYRPDTPITGQPLGPEFVESDVDQATIEFAFTASEDLTM
jgi:hypothetical protein